MKTQHINRSAPLSFGERTKFKFITTAFALTLAWLPSSGRADAIWVGDTSQDWNNAANWSSDPAAPTGNFFINTSAGGIFPVLSADAAFSPVDIIVGDGAGVTGRLDHTAGALATGSGNWLILGRDGGSGTYNLSGGTNNAGEIHMARTTATGTATATLNVSNATINTTGAVVVEDAVNNVSTCQGTLNIRNGGVVNSENDLLVAYAGDSSSFGEVNIGAGATVNVATTTKRWVIVNQWDFVQGRLNIDGGTLNLNADTDIQFSTGWYAPGSSIGTSSVTLTNGGEINGGANSEINLNNNADGLVDNTFNLNGGTLTIGRIVSGKANGSRVFNFNGGTLKPAANNASFFPFDAASTANVMTGGAIIDTAGFDITIGQSLGDGGGGLTKRGSGTLTFSGGFSYSGPTVVEAGALIVDATSYPRSGGLSVSNAASLTLQLNTGTANFNAGNVAFSGNSTLNLNYGSAATPTTAISATAVANSGTTTINISGTSLVIGHIKLIETGGSVPTNHFVLGTLPVGVVAELVDSGSSLDLNITASGQNLTWYGASSTGTPLTTWDINNSSNWNSGNAKYLEYAGNSYGDNVTFDDNVFAGSTNINLSDRVVPNTVTVSSYSQSYSITGSGGIDGATSLLISNSGSLFLGTSNNYLGGTFIAGDGYGSGRLTITNDNALGTNTAGATLSGGTLELAGNGTFSRAIDVVSNSFISVPPGDTVQYAGSMTGGSGVTKTGGGVLNLTVPNTISVGATISAGAIELSDAAAIANANVGLDIDNGLAFHGGIGTFSVGGLSGFAALNLEDSASAGITLAVGGNNSGTTYDGTLTGAGLLAKVGAGTFRLNGYNTYSGGTIVSGGALTAQAALIPGMITPFGTGTVTVSNGAQVELGRSPSDAFGSYSYPNDIMLNNGKLLAWDGSQRVQGNVTVAAGGGAIGSTFDAPWENFTEPNFPKSIFLDGLLTGTGALTIQHPGWATGNAWNTSCAVFTSDGTAAQNTYSGTVTVNPLTDGSSGGSYLYLVGTNVMANATITLTGNNSPTTGRMGISTLLFGNGSEPGPGYCTIGGLAGSGSLLLADTLLYTGDAGYSNGAPVALSVGFNNASTTYSGEMFGAGSLIKVGTGTLTLAGANAYTGNTVVRAGLLALAQPTLAAVSTVIISNSAVLQLDFATTNRITALVLNGVNQPQGVYNNANTPTYITGVGSLLVQAVATTPTNITSVVSGNTLTLSWPASHLGWILQQQTNSLNVGLSTNWVDVPGSASIMSTNITMNTGNPATFYRLRNP